MNLFGNGGDGSSMRFGLSFVIAAYLIYLGFNLIKTAVTTGAEGMPTPVAIIFGVLFIVAAGLLVFFRFKEYKETKAEREAEEAREAAEAEALEAAEAAKAPEVLEDQYSSAEGAAPDDSSSPAEAEPLEDLDTSDEE